MTATQNRRPSGVPAGGQFAAAAHAEATAVELTAPERTILRHEMEELTDLAQWDYDEAFKAYGGAVHDAQTTPQYGTAAVLDLADRRRTALRLAADPGEGRPDYADYSNPRTLKELSNALRDAKAGKVRGILIRNEVAAKLRDRLDVAGPKDGTPLYVDVSSGFCPLRITGGTVVINARSAMGNGIQVTDGATVVVIADPNRKVSTTVDGTGVATVVGAPNARGLQVKHGTEGHLDVVSAGDMTVRDSSRK